MSEVANEENARAFRCIWLESCDVLNEQRLSMTGITDPETRVPIGRVYTAGTLMVGKIDLSGSSIILDVSLVEVETARRMASSATVIVATDQMQRLWSQSILGAHVTKKDGGSTAAAAEGSAFSSLVKDFLVTNWPWVWTVLFVPVLTWFIARRRQAKGKSESEDNLQKSNGEGEAA